MLVTSGDRISKTLDPQSDRHSAVMAAWCRYEASFSSSFIYSSLFAYHF